jgi:pimeloyl-ACP methyl ester carboxylesterase
MVNSSSARNMHGITHRPTTTTSLVMIVVMLLTMNLILLLVFDTANAFVAPASHSPRPPHHLLVDRTTTLRSSFFTAPQSRSGNDIRMMEDLTFTPPNTSGIEEQACIDAAKQMKRLAVPVSTSISPSGSVGISYIPFLATPNTKKVNNMKDTPPIILLHGFDSSGLEYRRLGPQLAEKGIDAYAVDILGWGFTQLEDVNTFSASAKVEALKSIVKTLLGPTTPFCVAGASLGGAAAIELAAALSERPDNTNKYDDDEENDDDNNNKGSSPSSPTCVGLVLIDAQGFVDGVGPMALMPKPIAKIGVSVLRSIPLRNAANKMSYYNVEKFATDEAQVIGRLHCLREGWSDAMVSFMQSGGFSPSTKISKINSPALVLWGRQDGILEGKEFANKVGFGVCFLFKVVVYFDGFWSVRQSCCETTFCLHDNTINVTNFGAVHCSYY